MVNGQTPRTARIVDLLAHKDTEHNFVRVVGELHPEAGIRRTRGSREAEAWIPMLDGSGKRALLVELAEHPAEDAQPEVRTVVGMLKSLDSRVQDKLAAENNTIDGVAIDPEYMLVEGRHPGELGLWIPLSLLAGALLVGFLITFATRYVVFRRHPAQVEPGPDAIRVADVDLGATGAFDLDGQHRRRFLDVPSVLTRFENGQPVVIANVDASSRFMGFTTQKRAGHWVLPIEPGSVTQVEEGRLYRG